MNPLRVIYEDELAPLLAAIAVFYFVGLKMADIRVFRWGQRVAGVAYFVFVAGACAIVSPTDASQLAYIAFRGVIAAGIVLGPAWIVLSIAFFCLDQFKLMKARAKANAEATAARALSLSGPSRSQVDEDAPNDWQPKVRNTADLSPQEFHKYERRCAQIRDFEIEARNLISKLSAPSLPPLLPPSLAERRRLQIQIDELQLARQLFAECGDDPQLVGQTLADCDRRINELKTAIGAIPPEKKLDLPQLEGIAVFDDAVARRPKNPALIVDRARQYVAQQCPERAIRDANRALSLLPNYYLAFFIRAFAYQHMRKYSAAIRDLKRAIFENPNYCWAYVSLAAAYNATESYREALGPAYYASRQTVWGDEQLAIAYERLGEHEHAVHSLTTIIECDPEGQTFPNARVRRAKQLLIMGQTELATHDLKTHLARRDDPQAKVLLAQIKRLPNFRSERYLTTQEEKEAEDAVAQLKLLDV